MTETDDRQQYPQGQQPGYDPPDKPHEQEQPKYPPPDKEPECPPPDKEPECPPPDKEPECPPPDKEPECPPDKEPECPPDKEPECPPPAEKPDDKPADDKHPPTDYEGRCCCPPCPTCFLPKEDETIRRLLQALEDEIQKDRYKNPPIDAVTKFQEALKACDQEYKGFAALVKKYREFHCKIDCELDKAESWCSDVKAWCETLGCKRSKIEKVWTDCYQKKENDLECDYIKARDHLKLRENCLKQAEIEELEAKADFDVVKNFEQTLKDRFAELKTLYDKAKSHLDAGEYGAVCALGHEFRKIYRTLDSLELWADRRKRCEKNAPHDYQDNCDRPNLDGIDFRWFKTKLGEALRALILAKYQYFCRLDEQLRKEKERDDKKKTWDDFKATRREKFVGESQECAEQEEKPKGTESAS